MHTHEGSPEGHLCRFLEMVGEPWVRSTCDAMIRGFLKAWLDLGHVCLPVTGITWFIRELVFQQYLDVNSHPHPEGEEHIPGEKMLRTGRFVNPPVLCYIYYSDLIMHKSNIAQIFKVCFVLQLSLGILSSHPTFHIYWKSATMSFYCIFVLSTLSWNVILA